MSRLIIDFETDSAAFLHPDGEPDSYIQKEETTRILWRIQNAIANDEILVGDEKPILDVNGNKIGKVTWAGSQ